MTAPAAESTAALTSPTILANMTPGRLYEDAIRFDNASIGSDGALAVLSGEKTGRSPRDKRIVRHPDSETNVWWSDVNIPLEESSFLAVRQRAVGFLDSQERLYTVDGFAGWDTEHRVKVRVVCARSYHALFMRNMLIRPTPDELAGFGEPDFVIYNAGQQAADPKVPGVASKTCVALSFERGEMVILGTQYAGEMKKGVFTLMNYLMPKCGVLSMHCSANEGADGDVSLFFGLSGTGKTTLSADASRRLIGDDEHCWTDRGVFNVEGGCYAKCIHLTAASEPQIHAAAIRFGSVLENVVVDPRTHAVDYDDGSITENTRACYPIEFIANAKTPCLGGHPRNVILLACDAFGVLPPVARLSPEQLMEHFLAGYSAKVAGTEQGVKEPQATFSACFGAPFLVWHPRKYAELLAARLEQHRAAAWLINTGWTGGPYGVGNRISLAHTRAILDAIHNGTLAQVATDVEPAFGLSIPKHCEGVPAELLAPRNAWPNKAAYDAAAKKLCEGFRAAANL
ncbi:MAG: phosphoenolpyruvate carboxykinase (ATP) [Planctomycetota bacterium]|nr:MAG: phosphoenolpyruvate carboxykinase (ATP) [Planctomycetota bacterium]